MEKRVSETLGSKDYYTAHQTIISQCQRLERSGKLKEARDFALKGLTLFHAANGPANSIHDIMLKYVGLLEKSAEVNEMAKSIGLWEARQALTLATSMIDDRSWTNIALTACDLFEAVDVFSILIDCSSQEGFVDEVYQFAAIHFPANSSLFGPKVVSKLTAKPEAVLIVAYTLLISKCFESCSIWLSSIQALMGQPANPLIASTDALSQAWNASFLMMELLRRTGPPKDAFHQILTAAINACSDDSINKIGIALKTVYYPVANMNTGINPLASILQSMMSGK